MCGVLGPSLTGTQKGLEESCSLAYSLAKFAFSCFSLSSADCTSSGEDDGKGGREGDREPQHLLGVCPAERPEDLLGPGEEEDPRCTS